MGNPTRYSYPGAIYHVIPRSNNEENIFPDDRYCTYYLERLKFYSKKLFFAIYCYCIMKTHIHLLIEQRDSFSISKIMQSLNTSYVMYFNKRFCRKGRLFCCKFKAQLVDTDSYLLEASRYIHNNPVRAGLVDKPEDYKWSSYNYYIGLEKSDFIEKQKILDILDPVKSRQIESYKNFVSSDPELPRLNLEILIARENVV